MDRENISCQRLRRGKWETGNKYQIQLTLIISIHRRVRPYKEVLLRHKFTYLHMHTFTDNHFHRMGAWSDLNNQSSYRQLDGTQDCPRRPQQEYLLRSWGNRFDAFFFYLCALLPRAPIQPQLDGGLHHDTRERTGKQRKSAGEKPHKVERPPTPHSNGPHFSSSRSELR